MQRIAARVFLELKCVEERTKRVPLKKSAETSVTGLKMSGFETNEFSLQSEQNIVYFEINVNPASKLKSKGYILEGQERSRERSLQVVGASHSQRRSTVEF